jgi:MaoC like domain
MGTLDHASEAPLATAGLAIGTGPMPRVPVVWGVRDVIAYALGTGATPDADLDYLYEGRGPQVLPTFASCIATRWIPHLRPRLDASWGPGVIASHRFVRGDTAIGPVGRGFLEWDVRAGAVRSGAIVLVRSSLVTDSGTIVETETSVLHRRAPDDAALPKLPGPRPPKRVGTPVDTVRVSTFPQQAAIFRLTLELSAGTRSTDALHIDPGVAVAAGLPSPILHGPAVEGLVARSCLGAGALASVHAMAVSYRAPAIPGRELIVRLWPEAGPHGRPFTAHDRGDLLLVEGTITA